MVMGALHSEKFSYFHLFQQVKLPDGISAQGGLIVNVDPERRNRFWKRFMHQHQTALARSAPGSSTFLYVRHPPRLLSSRHSTYIIS